LSTITFIAKEEFMKKLGYWIESLRDDVNLPPQEFVRPMDDGLRRTLSDYLDSGEEYRVYRGESWCRFFCEHKTGHLELTDRQWVWPQDLGHYVREHGVALPPEFVAHVLGTSRPPGDSGPQDTDGEVWKAWCRQNASGEYRDRLGQARARADEHVRRSIAAAIARCEAEEGLSERSCMWAGCTNRALAGRSICAACWIRAEQEEVIALRAYSHLWPFLEFYPATRKRPLEQVIFDIAEYQHEEDYPVLYGLLRDTEMHLPVDITVTPAPSRWGIRYMSRETRVTTLRLVQGPMGASVLALTPSAREAAQGDFHAAGWVDVLKKVLEMPEAQALIVQGTTSWVQFDKARVRHVLALYANIE
jgi:hypothetical protein